MKNIIIHDYLDFVNYKGEDKPEVKNSFHTGYWNVFIYSEDLRSFLKKHNIKFTTKKK